MAAEDNKPEFVSSFQEYDSPTHGTGSTRAVAATGLGLTTLALLGSVVIVGTSSDTLSTFYATSLPEEFLLPLWPTQFSIRPTIALIVCGAIILVSSAASLAANKVPAISSKPTMRNIVTCSTSVISLIAALIATAVFYGINNSSSFTLQSWSCQWQSVDMNVEPYFGVLCKESRAALYLMIMMIPLECIVLGMVGVNFFTERKRAAFEESQRERKGSPAMS